MKLEGYPLYEVAQVICAAYNLRVGCRGCTADSNCPAVGMVGRSRLLFFVGQNRRGISIYHRPVYSKTLRTSSVGRNENDSGETHSDADAVVVGHGGRGARSRQVAPARAVETPLRASPPRLSSSCPSSPPTLPLRPITRAPRRCFQNDQRSRQQSVPAYPVYAHVPLMLFSLCQSPTASWRSRSSSRSAFPRTPLPYLPHPCTHYMCGDIQASHAPIYYRLPRSRLYVSECPLQQCPLAARLIRSPSDGYYALFAVATASTAYGAFQLVKVSYTTS